jgi:energy-coupling factor transporter ATP-binding protein EcfA2
VRLARRCRNGASRRSPPTSPTSCARTGISASTPTSTALQISQRLYVMDHGRIVFEGTVAEFTANDAVRKEWLEV